MKRHEEGITLIALIITIIILIILTAITISNVMGSNLFGLAKGAAENYVEAGKEEEKAIDKMIGIMQGWQVGDDSKVQPGDVVKITERDNYTDVDGRTATVPAGFKVSTKSSEQLVENGLVIQDENGNEFVWIPCTKEQYMDEKNDIMAKEWRCSNQYKDNGDSNGKQKTSGQGDGKAWRDNYTEDDNSFLNATERYNGKLPVNSWEKNQTEVAATSIDKNGGFYIARYEAGIPEEADFHISKTKNNYVNTENENFTQPWPVDITSHQRGSVADTDSVKNLKPVSKQGVQAWNYITQPNSKVVSENMYKDNDSVGSYLIDQKAWNYICSNIFKVGEGASTDSTNYGNYFNNRSFIRKAGTVWAQHVNDNNIWNFAKQYTTDEVQYSIQNRKQKNMY